MREGIKAGTGILSDAIDGKSIKSSASERLGQSAQRLTKKATRKIKERLNSRSHFSPPPGIPLKRKRKNTTKKRRVRRKRDIFG